MSEKLISRYRQGLHAVYMEAPRLAVGHSLVLEGVEAEMAERMMRSQEAILGAQYEITQTDAGARVTRTA